MPKAAHKIQKIYKLLNGHFGDLHWWPAETDFEVIVGAVLTQNTSWRNVEKAIARLKKDSLLDPHRIISSGRQALGKAIRSSGYYRVKADRLKEISRFIISECGGRLSGLKRRKTAGLRGKLLKVRGVGPETADSILLYALGKPVFVVDSYTKRLFGRHGIIPEKASYDDVQKLVHENFTMNLRALNQFHALILETAKRFCRKNAKLCAECPLRSLL